MCGSKHVEPSINFGMTNSITKLHLVGVSIELYFFVTRYSDVKIRVEKHAPVITDVKVHGISYI